MSNYKAERDTLIDDLSWYKAKVSRLEQRHSKLVDENTRLQNELYTMGLNQDEADDKIKRLEREKEEFKESHIKHITNMENYYKDRVQKFKEENKALRLQSDTYFEQWQQHKALNDEISQHIGNKPSSSTYKYFRAKLDSIGIKEGE